MLDTLHAQIGRRFIELATNAEFAAPKKNNGALKPKKCTTGLSCGGACISKTKICKRSLNVDQQKQFKELKKRLGGGDLTAAKGIQDLKDEQQGIVKKPKPVDPAPMQKEYFIDIASIASSRPKSDFDPKDIEDLADSIIEAGGLYRPLLLKQKGDSFEVVDNHLGYHAAVRAREKDSKQNGEVNGFVVKDDYISGSQSQIKQLKELERLANVPTGVKFQKKPYYVNDDQMAYFTPISDIQSSRFKSDFDAKDIEDMADSILANGGLLRPMILGQTAAGKYEVVEGHLAYYASVRAKEKDPVRAEEVNAFIISPKNMDNVVKQLKLSSSNKRNDAFNVDTAIKEVQGSNISSMEKSTQVSTLKKLDLSRQSHRAYGEAIVQDLAVNGKDLGGNESSLDRARELYRISNRKSLSDDDATEAGYFLRQGLRGSTGSKVNEASKLLGRDIYDRLSDSQKDAFAAEIDVSDDLIKKDPSLNKDPFIQRLQKRSKNRA